MSESEYESECVCVRARVCRVSGGEPYGVFYLDNFACLVSGFSPGPVWVSWS